MSTSVPKRIENDEDLYIPENLEELLVAFYQKKCPDKINNIPTILSKYHGKEKVLFNSLLKKYQEDPWPRKCPENIEVKETPVEPILPSENHIPSRDTILYHVNKEVEELKENLSNSELIIKKQKEELKMKDQMIDQNCQQIEELSLSLQNEKKEKETIESTLKNRDSQVESLQKQLEEKIATLEMVEMENKQKTAELEALQKASSSSTPIDSEEVEQLRKEVESLKASNSDLQNQLSLKQTGMKSILSKEYQQLREKIDEMEKQQDELDRSNSDLLLKNQQLEHDLEKMKMQAPTEKNDIEMHLTEVMMHNEDLEISLANERKQWEQKEIELQTTIQEKQNEIDGITNEKSKLMEEVDSLHKEKEGYVSENIEMKSKIEELEGLLSEEIRQKETKEKELQEKGQLLYDVEEERNVLEGAMKEIQAELKEVKESYEQCQVKCDEVVKDNLQLKEEYEMIKKNSSEVNEQLTDSLIQKLQTTVDFSNEKSSCLPVVSATVDASAFSLKSFLEFIETVLSSEQLDTSDLDKNIIESNVKEIQGLLLDRVITIRNLITEGVKEKSWDPKDSVTTCHNCHTQFTMMNRKHHCRYCGQAFCSNCSKKTMVFPGSNEKKRVCDDCFIVFDRLSGFMKELSQK